MDGARDMIQGLPAIDLVAVGLLLAGVLWGLLRGLARSFAGLLWVLLALGLGTTLAPVLLEHMPNTRVEHAGRATLNAFAALAGVLLLLPVLARVLGSGAGKAKQPAARPTGQRLLGGVAGLAVAALLATLLMPFALRLPTLAARVEDAHAPAVAERLAGSLALVYPAELGASLRGELDGPEVAGG